MLTLRFDMKDMGLADVILGIKIYTTLDWLILSQSCYVDKILEIFNNNYSSVAKTPMNTSQHLSKNKGESANLEFEFE